LRRLRSQPIPRLGSSPRVDDWDLEGVDAPEDSIAIPCAELAEDRELFGDNGPLVYVDPRMLLEDGFDDEMGSHSHLGQSLEPISTARPLANELRTTFDLTTLQAEPVFDENDLQHMEAIDRFRNPSMKYETHDDPEYLNNMFREHEESRTTPTSGGGWEEEQVRELLI